MSSQSQTNEPALKKRFQNTLNRHGYGFQYSVLNLAAKLCDENESNWIFEAAEFPVQTQGNGTRIDFILKLRRGVNLYLLAECKRANPALSDWCFAKAPFVRRNRTAYEPMFLEHTQITGPGQISSAARELFDLKEAYHIALEIKSDKAGDPESAGRGVIEEAATQVCRGLNGMVEFLSQNMQVLRERTDAVFLPVIFTTANLWASKADLSATDLRSGNIDLQNTDFTSKPWVFYQYHTSPGVKHSFSPVERPPAIGVLMESEYVRTIAIVSASGIEQFLKWTSNPDLYLP